MAHPRDLSVDDLLKELDDLPNAGAKKATFTAAAAAPSADARRPLQQSHAPHPPAVSAPRGSMCRQTSYSAANSPAEKQHPARRDPEPLHQRRHSASSKHKSAVDELLDDFDDLDVASPPHRTTMPARSTMPGVSSGAPAPSTAAPKCTGLFIGGSRKPRGRNGSCVGTVVCCDNLRCTKCDFKVIWFREKCWDDASVDYLFFRNNFPTEAKLAPALLGMPGSCAYCCQCSWQSSTREQLVDYGGDLRWVCAGHSL